MSWLDEPVLHPTGFDEIPEPSAALYTQEQVEAAVQAAIATLSDQS